jgi:hypothetical protein
MAFQSSLATPVFAFRLRRGYVGQVGFIRLCSNDFNKINSKQYKLKLPGRARAKLKAKTGEAINNEAKFVSPKKAKAWANP